MFYVENETLYTAVIVDESFSIIVSVLGQDSVLVSYYIIFNLNSKINHCIRKSDDRYKIISP